ncbi:helix-turn-helix domain-containing protein [Brevundimonas aveniformis]|uniref:helix-turn-helix domain-containing protein n=1 Tax=Brevundimonas aveniformis TaxID=370977 RepID=UPI00041A80B9|nr:helix-turn-helix transcriptional regulator [Brevundimonas aveniformis]
MDVQRRLGLQIQRLRTAKGWSQEELAYRADIHRTYISGLERGTRNPTVTVVERLVKALGCTWSDLLDRTTRRAADRKSED